MIVRRICYIIGIICLVIALTDLQEPEKSEVIIQQIEKSQENKV